MRCGSLDREGTREAQAKVVTKSASGVSVGSQDQCDQLVEWVPVHVWVLALEQTYMCLGVLETHSGAACPHRMLAQQ